MADVPQVDIVDGIPVGGTGTVQTISAITSLLAAAIADAIHTRSLVVDADDAAVAIAATNWDDGLQPGEEFIGQVGWHGFDVTDAPTTTNGAYAAGDVVGGYRAVTLARAANAFLMITGVQVTFKAAVAPNIRVVILGATPAATIADNAAFSTISVADGLLVRRVLNSTALGASYEPLGTARTIALTPKPFVMSPISGGLTIGYYLVDDTGVTLTSTSDVQVRFTGVGA